MPPRRRRTTRPAKRPEASRVVRVVTQEGWNRLLSKSQDRLLVVHFAAAWAAMCRHIRPYLTDLARKKQYRHINFVEVDYDSLQDISNSYGVEGCPTVLFLRDGEVLERLPPGHGSTPPRILEGLQKYGGDRPQSRLRSFLKKAAVVLAAAAAAGIVYHRMHKPPPTAAQQLAIFDRKMQAVTNSLTQARRQRQKRIVADLEKQLQSLAEQRLAISDLATQAASEEDRLPEPEEDDYDDDYLSEDQHLEVKWDDETDDEKAS